MVEDLQQGQEAEQLFVASCGSASSCNETWLIDSGCTSHMTPNLQSFTSLDMAFQSKVKIGNGEFVDVKGRGDVAVQTQSDTKLIFDVLYVP